LKKTKKEGSDNGYSTSLENWSPSRGL